MPVIATLETKFCVVCVFFHSLNLILVAKVVILFCYFPTQVLMAPRPKLKATPKSKAKTKAAPKPKAIARVRNLEACLLI
jgi:hypothetical protein